MLRLIQASTKEQIDEIRKLFFEYASSLDFNLCFQNFDKELEELPGEYSQPHGRLILAYWNDEISGCVGLRKIGDRICEMKRMYVKPNFRGKKIGYELAKTIIEEAKKEAYSFMRLDTIETMREAISLYEKFGFYRIEPYRFNPIENAVYMELKL